MKFKNLISISFLFVSIYSFGQIPFEKYFENKSLRFDFVLTGNSQTQAAYLLELKENPVWGGPVNNLIDPFNYGDYRLKIVNKRDGKLIYTKGFCTLFQEWRTTEESKTTDKAFTNSVSFPYPKDSITLILESRNKITTKYESMFRLNIDPKSIFINRSLRQCNEIKQLQHKGTPSQKVDLVVLAEGYDKTQQEKFIHDAQRLCDSLFSMAPFDKYKDDFNISAVQLISENSGVDNPGNNQWSNTALKSHYWTFGSERYLTIEDYLPISDAIEGIPCDAIIILANAEKYGGGGIFNSYAISSVDNARSARVNTHEFGHHFAALGDEYFNSSTAYDGFYLLKTEPWEPNITTLVHFDSKWKDMLDKNTPIPTPVDANHPEKIGVFEGGGYVAKGIYRPQDHCMMRDNSPFCPVCQRAIVRMINYICDRKQ